MHDRPWWAIALQWTLWGVAMTVVMGWLGRSRLKPRPATDANRLVQPLSTLIIGVSCSGFFAALAILSNIYPNETVTWWTTSVFVGFALLGIPLISLYFTDRHEAARDGLDYTTFFGVRKSIAWGDVKFVRYAPFAKWFRVESRMGDVARVSAMLMGLPEFARKVLENVPANLIEPGTLDILRETAAGDPPSIWG